MIGISNRLASSSLLPKLCVKVLRLASNPCSQIVACMWSRSCRHFTFSKIMAWVALDRTVRDAERFKLPAPLERWRQLRDYMHATICEQGFDDSRNTFTQSFGSSELDASLLLIPLVGFLPADDPRVRGTVAAIERELMTDGLVLRYRTKADVDGLPPGEGVFLPCTFWLKTLAAKIVAEAQLANINVGTRAETIAARKAALERAQASVVLAQKTYDRVSQLAEHGNAPIARLDQATDALHESQRAVDQAKSEYEQAVNGYTKEEREIAAANVGKALADIKAVQSIIDQMVVYAPVASQVYQRNVEPGEYVSPGVPLVTLIDLNDLWIHFDLREDLVKTLKVGDRLGVRIPALSDRRITVEVRLIATKGEYASWRATRATGDFDLRTFSIRAYPVEKVPELRPGMSAYLDWRTRQ